MITMETAQRWVAEIQADPRMASWLAEADKAYELQIAPTKAVEWFSQVRDGKAQIGMAETERPLPSFAHEILHVCLSARGYRHVVEIANMDEHKRNVLQAIVTALDNELQHHRMFDEFVAAGFDGGDFYHDGDDASHTDIRKEIDGLSPKDHPTAAFFVYLTLLAPGGGWPEGERENLTHLLESKVSADTWTKLQKIAALIDGWKHQADLDPTKTVAAIIDTLGDLENTFIGEPGAYPVGAFIPKGLTQTDFEAAAKAAYEAQHGKQ
ncbi:hypothetical protein V6R85_23885 [Agrobacterium sp. CCNWLW32]|uniref:hypothetical protein n=1 Tax=Agrobacterium sp. CCNWLW32 TaxID=3122072 RepID=UPI00300FCAD2